jgi:anti-sigma B factor antagonist
MTTATTTTVADQIDERTTVIRVRGDVTAASEQPLMAAYSHVGEKTRTVVLDFSGLDYMNSGGIGLLVTLLVRANRQKQKLLACGLNDHYKQIFELTRLDEAIGIHDSEVAALAAAKAYGGALR